MLTILCFLTCIITFLWIGYITTNLRTEALEEESSSCEIICVC